jgi:hypothetical protein
MSGTQTTAGIPAVAAAVGYKTETFGAAVTLGSNWTPFSYFSNNPSSIQATQNADGSVTIQDSGNSYGAQLESTEAFGGGAYFQATMSFPSGSAGGGTFWANDIQNMVDGNNGGNWVETDIAEFDDVAADEASNSYQIQYHNWYGGAGSTAQVYGEPSTASVPAGTNFAQPNNYGMLWVPATATSQGYIKFYFNGVQVGTTITWNQYIPGQSATQNPFAVIDSRQLDLLLGTGGSPTTVDNVQVWQASAADDVSLGSTPLPTPTPAPTPTPTPAPTPTATPSANDTVVHAGSTAAITDSSGNAWTITSGGQVAVNGTADTTTGNVTELAYVNGEVWQENAGGYWWGKTSPTAAWSPGAGTTTSPLPSGSTPTPTPSANDTVVHAGSSSAITDSSGNAWTITSGGKVAVNGTADTTTGNVTELAYVNGEVWQENAGGYWWGKTSPTAAWSPGAGTTTSPLPAASTPTPTPTPAPTPTPTPTPAPTPTPTPNEITPTSGGTLTDSARNQWTLTSAGVVQENGVAVPGGSGTAAFAIVSNVLYGQDATSKAWFTYSTASQYWASSAAPTATLTPPSASTPTPTPTSAPTLTPVPVLNELTPASGGTLSDNAGNTWTITPTGVVKENGTAVPDGSGTAALAIAGNVVYGQDAVSKDWFTYSLTTRSWSSSAAPPTTLTVTLSATRASGTISQSAVSIVATSGNHMVFISGSGDTVDLSGGTNTVTDTGNGNTYVIPAAGKGSDIFTNNVLTDGDTLDLRSALAATMWNGSTSTLADYLTVTNPSQGTVLSIAPTSGGTGVAIATINGATGTTLSSLLAHALT